MTAHEIHALAGAYAVDALDDLERARFEDHLAVCAECRAEVLSLQDATLLLSELSSVAPPAAMRDKVLADIKKIRPIPPAVVLIEKRRPRRWTNLVAAAAVLGVLGGSAYVAQDVLGNSSEGATISAAERVVTAPDAEHYNVNFKSGASATVYRSVAENQAALVAREMGAAPAGHVYQLWLLKDGKMVAAGTMEGGEEHSTILLRGSANDATGVGVTVEPERKDGQEAKTPSTEPIAEFSFEQKTT